MKQWAEPREAKRRGRGSGPQTLRRPWFEELEVWGWEPRVSRTTAGAKAGVPEWSRPRRPPPLGLLTNRSFPTPPERGRARRAAGSRGGAGGGGQCETGWCCCARVCSGPRCTSGCDCARRPPPAPPPPPPAPQVRFCGRVGWVAARGGRSTRSPAGSLKWGRAERDGPQTREKALFIPRALHSGKLEGALLFARPRRFSSPRFLVTKPVPATASPSAVPRGLVGVVRRLPPAPGARPRVSFSRERSARGQGSGYLPGCFLPPQVFGLFG